MSVVRIHPCWLLLPALLFLSVIATQWKRLSEHTLIVSLRLPAKPCLAVIADILSLSLSLSLLSLPLTYFSNIIVLPSGSLCSCGFSPSVFAKVKVEIGTGGSCSRAQCSLLICRLCCHPLSANPVGFSSTGCGRALSCYATAMSGITNINLTQIPFIQLFRHIKNLNVCDNFLLIMVLSSKDHKEWGCVIKIKSFLCCNFTLSFKSIRYSLLILIQSNTTALQ